ncbi:MAG: hypothetical protein E3J37_09290 [Anaerolineales bacterium]|nr:MAG: hypothetical protein E3J37_09290 [Anaerolineales bacterium]
MIEQLEQMTGMRVYPRSVTEAEGTTYFLARDGRKKLLGVMGESSGFEGQRRGEALLCHLTHNNTVALHQRLPWLRPQTLGLTKSAGCGDRLGMATPGHIRALRQVGGIAPVLAQQSMRENARTGRSPKEVVDDATWGVFQEGWREPWGADADHLKTTEDIDLCVAAGYTFFTIDPGDHVDNAAHSAPLSSLREKFAALPWGRLETTATDLQAAYMDRNFNLGDGVALTFTYETLLRAAGKYVQAIVHIVRMYRHLIAQTDEFELEISVDETETPTSALEHYFIASELKRLGVKWVSLAPRYIGRFEKGVDYIGDLDEFEADLAQQAAVARALGPYKLSLHSGSDKFSIYPIFARQTGGMVHLKTAGTSYLEGLRTIASVNPALFRDIYALAFERYEQDRVTYHVSADPARAPQAADLSDEDLPAVLEQFDAREMLHVTFGSALAQFGRQLKETLVAHEETHYQALEAHFIRHLRPFVYGE